MLWSRSDFQSAKRRDGLELSAMPWGVGFGFAVLAILTVLAVVTQVDGAKPYPVTPGNPLRVDEREHSEDAGQLFDETTHDANQSARAIDTGWRYSRTGWVQLAHEVGIGQQPMNWVQRMSPLVWAAVLWSAATWILAWAE